MEINNPSKKINILLVEDDLMAQILTKNILRKFNVHLDITDLGYKAINMMKESNYDLIFMDIGLPDISGFEVTQEIRSNESLEKRIPIIGLTAHDEEAYRAFAKKIGIDEFIIKPLTLKAAQEVFSKFCR